MLLPFYVSVFWPPGIEPALYAPEGKVLTTGSPGKSPEAVLGRHLVVEYE